MREADPTTRLRTPDSAAYFTTASATLPPSSITVSTCGFGRLNQSVRNDAGSTTVPAKLRCGVKRTRGVGSLTVLPRPTRRRKGRKTSSARARQSCAYISTTSRSILSTGTLSPAETPWRSLTSGRCHLEPKQLEEEGEVGRRDDGK